VNESGGRVRHSPVVRTPAEVFDDHLRRRRAGDVDGDVAANYAVDVVLVDLYGVRHGHEGVRRQAAQLERELPNASFEYSATHVAGDVAYLAWRAEADGAVVRHGADSFVIADGRIRAQTIFYRVQDG
jgi:hypothetical protein